jgi:UDP-glucuronate decarboxylase
MRILITGGAGFVGSHLCERLLRQGHEVLALDNLLTGSETNVAHLTTASNFSFAKHDVVVPFDGHFDRIYNLACPASPPRYQQDPLATARTSFHGTDNLLALATRTRARFLQASTSEVYGDPEVHPQSEDYRGNVNPIGPRACYDEGKRIAETLCFDYHRTYGTEIKVARIFNTYGPRMNPEDGRVVSNFVVQALRGAPLTIYGDGRQTRSFCYVDDLVDGLIELMESSSAIRGPLNLGNPCEFTMLRLADLVIHLTNSVSQIVYRPLPTDDPQQRRPEISRTTAMLRWTPKIGLEDGLMKTIAYFKKTFPSTARPVLLAPGAVDRSRGFAADTAIHSNATCG